MKGENIAPLQQLADPTLKGIEPTLPGWLEVVVIALSIFVLPFLIRAIHSGMYGGDEAGGET